MTPTMTLAERLATRAHAGQLDKADRPYIEHPAAVAAAVAGYGPDAVQAAWLHDVVEDTGVSLQDLAAGGFPPAVVAAVDSVTRREGETYMGMIRRAAADPLGRIVKIADNAHNSSEARLAHLAPDNAAFLRRRYTPARDFLRNAEIAAYTTEAVRAGRETVYHRVLRPLPGPTVGAVTLLSGAPRRYGAVHGFIPQQRHLGNNYSTVKEARTAVAVAELDALTERATAR